MKVIEHIDKAKNPLFSFEIVPPKRGTTVKTVTEIVKALVPFDPPWIDVTSHSALAYYHEKSDGSVERRIYKKRPGTIGICGIIQNRFKIDTVTHVLCQGFTKEETEDALIELNYLGIENVLAIRGDGPNYQKKIDVNRSINNYAVDLVDQIRKMGEGEYLEELTGSYPIDFCVGVAGYPEKHFQSPNMKTDLTYLKEKVDAGADYITTQMFFNNQYYHEFVKSCREVGVDVPIIPGLKVIKSIKQLKSIPSHFYCDMPEEFVDECMQNPDHVEEIGVNWAIKQTEDLLNAGSPVVHYYIVNDCSSVTKVLKKFR